MNQSITIELQLPSSNADAEHDTTGFIRAGDGGCVPPRTTGGPVRLSPSASIRLTLPALGLEEGAGLGERAQDFHVQGFMLEVPAPGAADDDTAGYGVIVDTKQLSRQAILLTPAILRAFNPQPDPPLTASDHDVRGFIYHDYAQGGDPGEPRGGGAGNGGSGPGYSPSGWEALRMTARLVLLFV